MNKPIDTISSDKICRILLVEDHPVYRKGLKYMIDEDEGICVCGEAESTATALTQLNFLDPDLAVVDIALKGRSGLDLIQEMKSIKPDLLVLVVSMFNETTYVKRALKNGARGYIVKSESAKAIVDAIHAILRGEVAISEPHRTRIIEDNLGSQTSEGQTSPQEILTNRELEVFRLIGSGKTRKEISEQLKLSIKTISTYQGRIKEKLDLRTAAELAKHAFQYVEKQRFGK